MPKPLTHPISSPSPFGYPETEEQPEGPGSSVVIAYLFLTLWGFLCGIGVGWLIWA